MQGGASKGDQFATRALACMNDVTTITRVGTISAYLGNMKKGQKKVRVKWDEVP